MISEKELNSYRLTSMEEPTDEQMKCWLRLCMRLPKYTTEKTKKLTEVILPICKNRLKNNDKNSI